MCMPKVVCCVPTLKRASFKTVFQPQSLESYIGIWLFGDKNIMRGHTFIIYMHCCDFKQAETLTESVTPFFTRPFWCFGCKNF